MLEVNCQYWIDNYDLAEFSNSIWQSGDPRIGNRTWENACEAILDGYKSQDKDRQIITSTAERSQVVEYFIGFGAWDLVELRAMSNIELSALTLQYIARNYRECEDLINHPSEYSGIFYRHDGDIWTTLSE